MFIREGTPEELRALDLFWDGMRGDSPIKTLKQELEVYEGFLDEGLVSISEWVSMNTKAVKKCYFKLIGKSYETSYIA